ncbi:hypothetical protein Mame01_16270 [Microbispora amethystogenes]|nr:hypothetical protein Mame01_16270 [Microbispora amethystogenes]
MDLFDDDPAHLPRSNGTGDGDWWERLISGSSLWSTEDSLAREYVPIVDLDARKHDAPPGGASDSASGADRGDADRDRDADGAPGGASDDAFGGVFGGASGGGSSSWVAVAAVGEAARVVALVAVPESAEVCLAEAEELLAARDRISSALAARVGRVHRSGEAKNHGHASTRLWLRSAGGMTIPGAGRLVTMGMELGRLSRVRERFAEGSLAEGIVEAICTATSGLTDEQATTAEGILLELAGSAGAAEVAKAGRYLRAVLDPDGHESDEQADFDRRFFRVRRRRNGGLEGEFYLPVEAAARLQHLLDVYAKPKAEGDDRTPSVRNADAFIAFLENKIATELLVLVNAESLPDDPQPTTPPATRQTPTRVTALVPTAPAPAQALTPTLRAPTLRAPIPLIPASQTLAPWPRASWTQTRATTLALSPAQATTPFPALTPVQPVPTRPALARPTSPASPPTPPLIRRPSTAILLVATLGKAQVGAVLRTAMLTAAPVGTALSATARRGTTGTPLRRVKRRTGCRGLALTRRRVRRGAPGRGEMPGWEARLGQGAVPGRGWRAVRRRGCGCGGCRG